MYTHTYMYMYRERETEKYTSEVRATGNDLADSQNNTTICDVDLNLFACASEAKLCESVRGVPPQCSGCKSDNSMIGE